MCACVFVSKSYIKNSVRAPLWIILDLFQYFFVLMLSSFILNRRTNWPGDEYGLNKRCSMVHDHVGLDVDCGTKSANITNF